jgi:hypothetical protein
MNTQGVFNVAKNLLDKIKIKKQKLEDRESLLKQNLSLSENENSQEQEPDF